jgi:hypothetical protein
MGNSCGYCVKAENLLKKHIHSGKIQKKSHTECNGKFSGFPAFLNTANGNTHTGLPSSAESLFEKLGYRDGDGADTDPPDAPLKVTDYYVVDAEFNKNSKYHILVINNNGFKSDPNLAGIILQDVPIGAITKPAINVYFKSIISTTITGRQITTDDKVVFLKDVVPHPKGLFPCVPQSAWATTESISVFFRDPKNRKLLMPPAPCKSNSKVFCCPNTDVDACPEQPFFDAKTIIMISLIALLVIIMISYMMKMYKK